MTASPDSALPRRLAEVDALKAAGIVTVVLIHSVRSDLDPAASPLEIWIGHATRFAVPAFLFASGFLYATPASGRADVLARRLRRVLAPYLVASLLAQVWPFRGTLPAAERSLAADLAWGASFGPYYYVFVIAGLVVATPLLVRLPRRVLAGLAVAFVAVQWPVDALGALRLPLFWQIRSPLLWWGYFLAGLCLRPHRDELAAWLAPRRPGVPLACAAAAALLLAAVALARDAWVARTAAWLAVYAVLAGLFAASCGRETRARGVRFLSDATYFVYLFHLFFVYAAVAALPPPPGRADPAALALPFTAGLLGPVALVALLRRALGPRARDWLGA